MDTTATTTHSLGHLVAAFLRSGEPVSFRVPSMDEATLVSLRLDGDVVMLDATGGGVETTGVTSAALGARSLVDLVGLPSTTPVVVA